MKKKFKFQKIIVQHAWNLAHKLDERREYGNEIK